MSGVGYKKPPIGTRWKKGQSGNPGGKKKGTLDLKADLIAELGEIIQINEGGSPRRISKQRALLKSLAARGIQGDARAANLLLRLIDRLLEPPPETPAAQTVSADDQEILDAYIDRLQRQRNLKGDDR